MKRRVERKASLSVKLNDLEKKKNVITIIEERTDGIITNNVFKDILERKEREDKRE